MTTVRVAEREEEASRFATSPSEVGRRSARVVVGKVAERTLIVDGGTSRVLTRAAVVAAAALVGDGWCCGNWNSLVLATLREWRRRRAGSTARISHHRLAGTSAIEEAAARRVR